MRKSEVRCMSGATVSIPEELAESIGRLAGADRLEKFVLEAVEERLRRLERRVALESAAGSVLPGMVPEWETPEAASAWVREQRRDRDLPEGAWGDALPHRHDDTD
jgi:hypothetical protein